MNTLTTPQQAFAHAVQVARGQAPFAVICGCTQGNISQLLRKGSLLPAHYVPAVESATGVSRHLLRPDVYPLTHGATPPALPELPADDQRVAGNRKPILSEARA